jgi:hypothetical protein
MMLETHRRGPEGFRVSPDFRAFCVPVMCAGKSGELGLERHAQSRAKITLFVPGESRLPRAGVFGAPFVA